MSDELKGPEFTTTANETGQAESAPVMDKASEHFFEFQFDGDREPTKWSNKDELAKYLREGTLRHRDYTKKTQSHSEERKSFEKQRTDYDQQMKDFMGYKTRYDQIDQFLRSRPDVQERIVREMRGTSAPVKQNNEMEQKLSKEIQALKEEFERKDRERQNEEYRNQVFDTMGKKYEDFSRDDILEMMQEVEGFQSLPPQNAMESFAELLYHARKGRSNPAQMEERIAQNLQKKAQATTPMPGKTGGGKPPTRMGGSMDDIAAELKKQLR